MANENAAPSVHFSFHMVDDIAPLFLKNSLLIYFNYVEKKNHGVLHHLEVALGLFGHSRENSFFPVLEKRKLIEI